MIQMKYNEKLNRVLLSNQLYNLVHNKIYW